MEGVERDHAGPIVARLEQMLARESARMIYVIPTCHNPTGGIMSEARRMAVLRLARESRAVVVEDAVMEDLILDRRGRPVAGGTRPRSRDHDRLALQDGLGGIAGGVDPSFGRGDTSPGTCPGEL